jgi:transposase
VHRALINKTAFTEICLYAWVLERIQDHPANRIDDLMAWAYQDMIDAQNAEAEAKDAA